MKATLVIFFLTIQSSYANDSESDATPTTFDTVQFYAAGDAAWRIKTYAMDEDVHFWSLGEQTEDIVALARRSTEKHYGDVLAETCVIETEDGIEGLKRELASHGLETNLELPPFGAVFWAPAGTRYRTKSEPE